MRRRTLLTSGSEPTPPSEAAPLEVAFYNSDIDGIVIRKQEDWVDGETPIGIVVVPGYHNRYGDGSCGVMSLVGMDYNHPTSGEPITSSTQTDGVPMAWGFNYFTIDNNMFTDTGSTYDLNIPYQVSSSSTICHYWSYNLIWPYEGTVNGNTFTPSSAASTTYSNTGTYPYVSATRGNIICDFNGIRNTAAIYVRNSAEYLWTGNTIYNNSSSQYSPATICASRFKTVGTKSFLDVYSGITANNLNYGTPDSTKDNKGFWYLPALGELCYLTTKMYSINNTILALNQKYGNVGIQLKAESNQAYHASCEKGSNTSWNIIPVNGTIRATNKSYNDEMCTRAFMRL